MRSVLSADAVTWGMDFRLPVPRHGQVSPTVVLALSSIVAVLGLAYSMLLLRPDARHTAPNGVELRVYCAAGVAEPINQALLKFREQTQIDVSVTRIGGSGTLFGQLQAEQRMEVARGADLFVSADASLVERGYELSMFERPIPLAIERPVIATRKGHPLPFRDFRTLCTGEHNLRIGIACEQAAIGRLTRQIAQDEGVLTELLDRCKLETENVMQLALALQTGAIDVAVVWDATVTQTNRWGDSPLLAVAEHVTDTTQWSPGHVTLGIVCNASHNVTARRLAEFLTTENGGVPYLEQAGLDCSLGKTGS